VALAIIFGMWALIAVLVFLPERKRRESSVPAPPPPYPTSHAA
jgi:hypothetical protein